MTAVTLDTDTTVHTVFGKQMGARKGYNPRNKGKKSYQPILTFLAETREYVGGELHNGDRPTGIQIARHLESVLLTLPKGIETIYARPDSGFFYCWEAVQAYRMLLRFVLAIAAWELDVTLTGPKPFYFDSTCPDGQVLM